MSPLLISLGTGVFIGLLYALLNVRSPAPPAIALVGLLGMILGGQLTAQFMHKDALSETSAHTRSLTVGSANPAAKLTLANQAG